MIKKLKQAIRAIWQDIKSQVDFEHVGLHIENYTNLFVSTFGMAVFSFLVFMEWAFFPVLLVEWRMAVVAKGDTVGTLFNVWPILSFGVSMLFFAGGLCWSVHEFGQSFSSYDYHYKRVIELRARINDIEGGIRGNGKQNEWLKSLKFQDSDEARKVANFVFLGRQLGFKAKRVKEIVEAHFKD